MADIREGQGAAPSEWPPAQYPVAGRPLVDETTQSVQATVEGIPVEDGSTVEFMGKRFRMADNVALMPLLKFAHASKKGLDSDDMDGLDAMYRLIRSTLDRSKVQVVDEHGTPQFDEAGDPIWAGPSQWELFEEHADEMGAEGEDLMDFVNRVMPLISARPRKRRGDSASSSPQTSATLKDGSPSRAIDPRLEGMTPVSQLSRRV